MTVIKPGSSDARMRIGSLLAIADSSISDSAMRLRSLLNKAKIVHLLHQMSYDGFLVVELLHDKDRHKT
jgi:hypothetical protein